MKPPEDLTRIIDEKRYSTKTATLLCGDDYWDGRSWERHGRNTWLYRTPKGKYFQVYFIECQGEQSEIITPRSLDEAVAFFERCRENCRRVSHKEAFPTWKSRNHSSEPSNRAPKLPQKP